MVVRHLRNDANGDRDRQAIRRCFLKLERAKDMARRAASVSEEIVALVTAELQSAGAKIVANQVPHDAIAAAEVVQGFLAAVCADIAEADADLRRVLRETTHATRSSG